jgi:hypothetical protein
VILPFGDAHARAYQEKIDYSTTCTTNASESFHSHFKSQFYSNHSFIFIFVDVLLRFQTFIYSKIKSANTVSKKLRKDVNQQKKHLENLISKNNNYVLDIFSHVKAVSYYNKI